MSRSLTTSRSKVSPALHVPDFRLTSWFAVLADIALDPMEECQSIISLPVGDSRKYIVGTAFVLPTESEPTKGRLLLFSETASRSYELTAQINVDGCAYALASLTDNHVAAAVNSQVRFLSRSCDLY